MNLRPGPLSSGIRAARDFMAVVSTPMPAETTAATLHVASQFAGVFCREASHAAPRWEIVPRGWEIVPPGWEYVPPGGENVPPGWEYVPPGRENVPPGWENAPP